MTAHELKPLLLLLFLLPVMTIFADTASAQSPGQNGDSPAAVENDPLAELEAWNRVKNSRTATDFQAFLKRFPNGAFAKQASQKMNELGDPVWNEVRKSNDPFKYRDYIRRFPNSPFAAEARMRMTELAAAAIEWEKVKGSKDPDAYINFIEGNHTSPYLGEAKQIGSELMWEKIRSGTSHDAFRRFARAFPDSPYAAEAKRLGRELNWEQIKDSKNFIDFLDYTEYYPDAPNIAEAKQKLDGFRFEREVAELLRYSKVKFSLGQFGEGWNEFSFTGPCTLKSTSIYGWNVLATSFNPIKYEVTLDLTDVSSIRTQKVTPPDRPELVAVVLKNASGRKTTFYATTYSKTPMWGDVKDRLKDEEPTDPWVGTFGNPTIAERFAEHLRSIVKDCTSGGRDLKAQSETAGPSLPAGAPKPTATAGSDSVAALHDHGGMWSFAFAYGRLEFSGAELKFTEMAKEGFKEPKTEHNFALPCSAIKSVKKSTDTSILLRPLKGPERWYKIDENSERAIAFINKVKAACGRTDD